MAIQQKHSIKLLLLAISGVQILSLSACFYFGQEGLEYVVSKPPAEWSSRDCLTVIVSAMVHNLQDNEKNVECIATPFYPSVVVALNQIQKTQYHWSDEDARFHMNELLQGSSGLYVDWKNGRFVNAKGNYFKDQTDIDSLLIVITLKNKSWPCAPAVSVDKEGARPIIPLADYPCYLPNISDIEDRIVLVNGNGDTLRPKFVWGRRHDVLTSPETLFAMFPLRRSGTHFLRGSLTAALELSGFDTKMKFPMETARMR